MKISKIKLKNIVDEELKGTLSEASWLDNLDQAEPAAMLGHRVSKSKPDRYPNLGHAGQAIRMFFLQLIALKKSIRFKLKTQKELFRQERVGASLMKTIAVVDSIFKNKEYKRRLANNIPDDEIIQEYYNQAWDDIIEAFRGIEKDLEDLFQSGDGTVENLFPQEVDRLEELIDFILQISNARISSMRVGFDLDPAGIRALGNIPAGIDYEKPAVQ